MPGGALSLDLLTTQTMVTTGILPLQGKVKLESLIPRCCHTNILIILFLWCPAVTRVVVDSGCVYMKLCCSRSMEMYLSIEHDLHVCCTEYISITNFKFRWFLGS